MTSDRESKLLSPEEKKFINRLATHYAPTPMTLAQRVAFDRALEERLARRPRASLLRPVAVVATACAALLIWLAAPRQSVQTPSGVKQPGAIVATRESATHPEGEDNLLTYAYYDSELYEDENEEKENFLSDDYEALVSAFALPDA